MSDFDKFDKQMARMTKAVFALWIAGAVISLGTILFMVWVVIQLLQYFGVI